MTGRGRPRKAKSPDSKDKGKTKEMKQVPVPKSLRKVATEEQKDTAKEKKRKDPKTNPTAEKPSVQDKRREETTQPFTAEPKQQQKTTIKATTCAGRAKATGKSAKELNQKQLETPKDARNDSLQTTKGKKCAGYGKPMVKLAEEITKEQMPKAAAEARVETTKPKRCSGKVKETTPKYHAAVKACAPRDGAGMNAVLSTTLSGLKIKRNDRSEAAEVVNKITDDIIRYLKQNSESFKNVEEPLRTGSYYEHLKISDPDEFDVMVPIPVERAVDVEPFGDDGAFYTVGLKRGISSLQKFQEGRDNLSASEMLSQFRDDVKNSVQNAKEWQLTRKKKGCPAVTMTTKFHSTVISLDVVLCLMVKSSWPPFTKDGLKIEAWLGRKVKQDYKRMPYYLVPKYEGSGTVENNGVPAKDSWRISFSHIEKAILKNHGSEKTCCEKGGAPCCRKDCLKLLKHLLSLLKERDPSLNKFCSYHAKTTLLHACCSRPKDSEWKKSNLSHCFNLLLDDFVSYLEAGELYNFFIPTQNLFSGVPKSKCKSLAHLITEERDNGFPIFK